MSVKAIRDRTLVVIVSSIPQFTSELRIHGFSTSALEPVDNHIRFAAFCRMHFNLLKPFSNSAPIQCLHATRMLMCRQLSQKDLIDLLINYQ